MRIKPFVNHRRGWGLPWLLIAILLLTSCGQPTPTPSPTPTKTPKAPAAQATDAATATSAVNVPAVQATDTPAPPATDTPAPPTDTPAPPSTPPPAPLPGGCRGPAAAPMRRRGRTIRLLRSLSMSARGRRGGRRRGRG